MVQHSELRRLLGAVIRHSVTQFCCDARGTVAIIFGLAFIPLIIAMGVAVDYSQTTTVDHKLSRVADSVALAAANVHSDPEAREALAHQFVQANGGSDLGDNATLTSVNFEFDDDNQRVTVTLTASVETLVMSVAHIDHLTATARSVAAYATSVGQPLSMAMALDVSGSMSWNGKIDNLITAASNLLDQLEDADIGGNRLRTGLVTYAFGIQETVQMDWGISHTMDVVEDLPANGGTSSTDAMNRIKNWLISDVEDNYHLDETGDQPLKFALFMTDGDNNYSEDDTKTLRKCRRMKNNGVEIFTVAFEAPAGGQALLEACATSEEHYFNADNEEEFLAAFEVIGEQIQEAMLRIVE